MIVGGGNVDTPTAKLKPADCPSGFVRRMLHVPVVLNRHKIRRELEVTLATLVPVASKTPPAGEVTITVGFDWNPLPFRVMY